MLAEKLGRPSIYIVREGFGARAAHVELGGCVSDPHALRVWGHLLRLDRPCSCAIAIRHVRALRGYLRKAHARPVLSEASHA